MYTRLFSSVLSRDKGLCAVSTSTDINADKLAEFFVEKLKECVLPPTMCCHRRMFAMMHLRNFCQVSIEEMWQWWRVRLSKVPFSTEIAKGVVGWRLDWRQLELRNPCEKFLATPLSATAVVQELRGHSVVVWEQVELLHSGHAAVVQWYIAAGRLAQSYSSPAGKVWTWKPTELRLPDRRDV